MPLRPHQRRYDVLTSQNKITRLERNNIKIIMSIYVVSMVEGCLAEW